MAEGRGGGSRSGEGAEGNLISMYIYTHICMYIERERSRLGGVAEEAEGAESNSIIYIERGHALGGGVEKAEGAEGNRSRYSKGESKHMKTQDLVTTSPAL